MEIFNSLSKNELAKLEQDYFAAHEPKSLDVWRKATVGIAGAGGLGSNIAISLYRAGIGKLVIADFDIINITNLNRQQFYYNQIGDYKVRALESNLRKIHPFCKIESHLEKVTTDNLARLFADVDVLIEAFDLAEQKQMLIEHWLQLFPEKPLICASGLAGFGKNELLRQHQSGKLFFCGDGISELVQGISPVAPRVAIVANLQANLCLEILVEVQK